MTVGELIEMLGDFKPSYNVKIMPEDTELSAKMCKGGIFIDGGILVIKEAQDDDEKISL